MDSLPELKLVAQALSPHTGLHPVLTDVVNLLQTCLPSRLSQVQAALMTLVNDQREVQGKMYQEAVAYARPNLPPPLAAVLTNG